MRPLTESRRLRDIELSLIRRIMQDAPPDAINLALGELGFPLPDILRQKALELLREATPVYTPNAGLPELRAAIASQYPGCTADQVCVCNGVEEAIFVSLLALLDPGDLVAIPDPDYPAYPAIVKILECKVIRLPFESDLSSVDRELWARQLNTGVKALILSHPSNPAGHLFSEEEMLWLVETCHAQGITLVVDEIYSRLLFQGQLASPYGLDRDIVFLGGLSKSHCMSGWRIGWAVSPPELAGAVIKARQYVSTCSNWLSQQLAVFALSAEGRVAADEVLAELQACRRLAREKLEPWGEALLAPDATPYLMLRVKGDDLRICSNLASRGVICVPGSAFGERSRGWLRLNYAVGRDKLAQALEIINDELHLH